MSQRRSLAPRVRVRPLSLLVALIACGGSVREAVPSATTAAPPENSRRWTLIKRVQTQDQGDWQVDYELKLDSASPVRLEPSELALTVRGAVSNSRAPSHAFPRVIATTLSEKSGANVLADVIPSSNELFRCRERLVARFWATGEDAEQSPAPFMGRPTNIAALASPLFEPMPAVTVPAGGVLHVRFRLEHDHFLHGPYDPLLGRREVELKLGNEVFRDVAPLDREQYLAQGRESWSEPPEDRRDTRHYVTAPDSLCLEAHVPGNNQYRFTEKPVRYATKMRLSFWYLIAPGTEGDFRMQITQYKDSPNGWQILHPGMIEKTHKTVGRWTKVEHVFHTEPQATSLALSFRIMGSGEVGEVWVDDVQMEPVAAGGGRP